MSPGRGAGSGRNGTARPGLHGLCWSLRTRGATRPKTSPPAAGAGGDMQGRNGHSDDAGLVEEDPVALLPYLGGEAVLAGLAGGEGEVPHRDGPGDVRGPGHLAAGEPVRFIADVADLAPTGPGQRHVHHAGADRRAVGERIAEVPEVRDLEILQHPRRPPAARRYRDRPARDPGCPEQPARGDARVEVVNLTLIGADRPREDVKSKEAETRVGVPPVQRDVLPGHEPVIHVEAQAGAGTGAGAGDVSDAGEAVEIGDCARLAGAREEHVEHLGARPEWLDTARDRPRIPGPPRRQRRARPEHLSAEEPGGAQPRAG